MSLRAILNCGTVLSVLIFFSTYAVGICIHIAYLTLLFMASRRHHRFHPFATYYYRGYTEKPNTRDLTIKSPSSCCKLTLFSSHWNILDIHFSSSFGFPRCLVHSAHYNYLKIIVNPTRVEFSWYMWRPRAAWTFQFHFHEIWQGPLGLAWNWMLWTKHS